mgnify:CR=1 FL=1
MSREDRKKKWQRHNKQKKSPQQLGEAASRPGDSSAAASGNEQFQAEQALKDMSPEWQKLYRSVIEEIRR